MLKSLAYFLLQNFSQLSIAHHPPHANLTGLTTPTLHSIAETTYKSDLSFAADQHRMDLAIFESRDEIIQKISDSPIVIITGPTGCGKVSCALV